jgi:hypothetical protein
MWGTILIPYKRFQEPPVDCCHLTVSLSSCLAAAPAHREQFLINRAGLDQRRHTGAWNRACAFRLFLPRDDSARGKEDTIHWITDLLQTAKAQ